VLILLDTNVIISAILFGGIPRQVLELAIDKRVQPVTSPLLLSELSDILRKKFKFSTLMVKRIDTQIRKIHRIVEPDNEVRRARDSADNRVLEAASFGMCDYIVTGDKDLLDIQTWHRIKIVTPAEFIVIFQI
jgi:putative PIN family toxin of toxin-antitoxin system